ncbi:phosphoribosylglycinamide synthetase [Kluyvera genomosp. 2]|uniref:Phosphoribosylglycinamide synthetase n=1 Tax=Kluyvera genomosp. 2 TaxID=2774054 RepID=A0A2T2Y7F0_9ENTR|nr:phosphoribosylglycinamide synthetase [Kluyvera genomosp. 2]
MRQLATDSRVASHRMLKMDDDFISTQTVSSGRRILYNSRRSPPLRTLKAEKTRDL